MEKLQCFAKKYKKRILTASAVCTDPADLSHVDAGTGKFRCDVVFL